MKVSFRLNLSVFAALISVSGAALAHECSGIQDNETRLACFDTAFPAQSDLVSDGADVDIGNWSSRIERSQMTDDTNVFLSVSAEAPVQCGWSRGGTPTLIVRCLEDTASVIFSTDCHMTSSRYNNYGDVTYRLDDEPPRTRGFVESTNNRSLGLWRGSDSIPFIRAMLDNDRMLARMTPFSENAIEMEFDISGLEEAILPLRDACGW